MSNKQTKGLKRNTIDKFYTKDSVVEICVGKIKELIEVNDNDLLIEPSAGNGAFIKCMKQLSSNCLFYDIEPEHDDITKQDYLELDETILDKTILDISKRVHVIGNPPFGRQSSLAIKFIKKSAKFCDSISFILPRSFMKESMTRHFPKNFHLRCEIKLDDKSFCVNGEDYGVPCVFQIWEKDDKERNIKCKQQPLFFQFVKRDNNPDISFRRVGINAGSIEKIERNEGKKNKNIKHKDKSEQSHYFIKFNTQQDEAVYDQLSSLNFDCKNNTVGPKSISKQELIEEFNKILVS